MEPISFVLTCINKIVELVASTNTGQFVIDKFDSLLWTLEQPAKYCVNGNRNKVDGNHKMAWPVFWTILIYLQFFRLIISTILVQFNERRIESEDIVKIIQKGRRTLHTIRFASFENVEPSNGNGGNTF